MGSMKASGNSSAKRSKRIAWRRASRGASVGRQGIALCSRASNGQSQGRSPGARDTTRTAVARGIRAATSITIVTDIYQKPYEELTALYAIADEQIGRLRRLLDEAMTMLERATAAEDPEEWVADALALHERLRAALAGGQG